MRGAACVDGGAGGVCGGAGVGMLARGAAPVKLRIARAEWVLLLTLAALPFCGYLLARFVTHSIEVRYVLGALVAIAAMVGVAVGPWLRRDAVFNAVLVVLGLGIVGAARLRIHAEQQKTAARLASLVLPACGEGSAAGERGWAAVCAGHGHV